MLFHIRPAVPEDCQHIRPLQEEIALLHHKGRPDMFKPQARFMNQEAFTKRLSDPSHTILIAESENGEIVGYVFAWLVSYRDNPVYLDFDRLYIDDICVLKKYQRLGIGKALLAKCVEIAKNLSCKDIELGVWSFNQEAITFYEHCGMTERARRMELPLAACRQEG